VTEKERGKVHSKEGGKMSRWRTVVTFEGRKIWRGDKDCLGYHSLTLGVLVAENAARSE
jgi:hypothetical protein